MAIKLEDTVSVVQKEIRKWREKIWVRREWKRARPPNYDWGRNYDRLFLSAYGEPQEVAKIFVDYDYALYYVLGEDAPDAMWEDLGRKFGLEYVCSVDLQLKSFSSSL